MKKFSDKKIDVRKTAGTIIGGIAFICCILFFTYAFYQWRSGNTDVVLGIQDESLTTQCILGADVNVTNIGPVLDYKDGVKTEFSVSNNSSSNSTVGLSLDITYIDEVLLVDSFKYVLVYDTAGGINYDYDNPVLGGDFSNLQVGSNVITSALTIDAESTYSYQFIVYIDGNMYNDSNIQGSSLDSSLMIGDCGLISSSIKTANQVVQNLYNNGSTLNTVNIGGDTTNPTVSLNATQGIMLDNNGEYRYYGANPNNYVSFNGELWRIISISNVKSSSSDTTGEQRMKIVRADSIGNYSWDSSDSAVNSGYGVNDWSKADLMTELNTLYYSKKTDSCYIEANNATTVCDFSSIGLNSTSKNLIDDALWYLGGSSSYDGLYADDYYNLERSTTVFPIDGSTCSDGACPRTTSWTGKIGLMYPSDYAYAADLNLCKENGYNYSNANCKGTDWLFDSSNSQWTISPFSSHAFLTYYVNSGGHIPGYNFTNVAQAVRPVVYLKSDVVITGGTGTSGNPYQLGIPVAAN